MAPPNFTGMNAPNTATDVASLSDDVLRALSWSSDFRQESVRRERDRQQARVVRYLADLVETIRGMDVGPGAWASIAELLCCPKTERRMRAANVCAAAVVAAAGIDVAALR